MQSDSNPRPVAQGVTEPGSGVSGTFPTLSYPPKATQTLGICSDYMDVGSTFNRFVFMVQVRLTAALLAPLVYLPTK